MARGLGARSRPFFTIGDPPQVTPLPTGDASCTWPTPTLRSMSDDRGVVIHEDDCPEERWDEVGGGAVPWRTLLSADRTPTSAMTVGVVDIPCASSRASLTLHRHAPPETYYVLHGSGFVEIDGQVSELRTGSAAFIPGGAWHRAWSETDGGMRMLYAFAVDSFDEVIYEFAPGD